MPTSQLVRKFSAVAAVCALLALEAPLRADEGGEWPEAYLKDPAKGEAARADKLRADLEKMIAIARDRVFPALVNIETVTVMYWDGRDRKGRSVGSGTIISPEGYVLTNAHVAENGRKYRCTLADKQQVSAELVGEDPLTDLAVLKLKLSDLKDASKPLIVGEFGDSAKIEVGDYVMAMGSPFALSQSVTLGIVSNTERVFTGGFGGDDPEEMELNQGQRTGLFNRFIQHDALINPGNSGGPLVNMKGEVVGVNARGGGSMGFAIPSALARQVADSLIKNGEVIRSSFGVSLRPIDRTGFDKGVLVNSVVKDSPADKAGIQAGDVITTIDGADVTVRFHEQAPLVMKLMADYPVGASVKLGFERAKEAKEATVVTEKLEKDRGKESAFHGWGLTAIEITRRTAREWRLDSTEGALVTGVRQGGPSQLAEPPLQYGDVIRAVDGETVATFEAFVELYKKKMDVKPLPERLLLQYDRRGKSYVTSIKPKPDKEEDPPREVAKAWIGVATQPIVKELADHMTPKAEPGYRVTRIYPGTKAAASGLKIGDIIVNLDGSRVQPKGLQDAGLFDRQVRKLDTDGTAKLSVLRDGAKMELEVPLERTRLTAEEALREKNRDFELNVREVTFFDRDDNRWEDDVKGVIVEQVESAGWADLGGVRMGDLIQRFGGTEVTGIESYRKAMEKVMEEKPERVVVVVLRGSRTFFQFVEPEWKPVADGKKSD